MGKGDVKRGSVSKENSSNTSKKDSRLPQWFEEEVKAPSQVPLSTFYNDL